MISGLFVKMSYLQISKALAYFLLIQEYNNKLLSNNK